MSAPCRAPDGHPPVGQLPIALAADCVAGPWAAAPESAETPTQGRVALLDPPVTARQTARRASPGPPVPSSFRGAVAFQTGSRPFAVELRPQLKQLYIGQLRAVDGHFAAAPHVVPGSVPGERRPPPVPSAPGLQAARAGVNHRVSPWRSAPPSTLERPSSAARDVVVIRVSGLSVLRGSGQFQFTSASKPVLVPGGDSLVRGPRGHLSQVFARSPSGHSV